jgi:hypothetical protein
LKGVLLPTYTCITPIALSDGLEITKSRIIRTVQAGEKLEGLAVPAQDTGTKLLRVQVRVGDNDGWVTIRGNQGTVFIQQDKKPATAS